MSQQTEPRREDRCLFCAIVAREIPATIVSEDDATLAFRDIAPAAPTHIVVVPKNHYPSVLELAASPGDAAALLAGITRAAAADGVAEFRTVLNTGASAGQSVLHVHAHLLAGRPLRWPPA